MPTDLSQREHDVLRLLGKGRTTAQIAKEFGIAETTVAWYVSRVVARLGSRRTDRLATTLARAAWRRAIAFAIVAIVLALGGEAISISGVLRRVDLFAPATPSPQSTANVRPYATAVPMGTGMSPLDAAPAAATAGPADATPPSPTPAPFELRLSNTGAPLPVPTASAAVAPPPLPSAPLPLLPLPSVPIPVPGVPRIP